MKILCENCEQQELDVSPEVLKRKLEDPANILVVCLHCAKLAGVVLPVTIDDLPVNDYIH